MRAIRLADRLALLACACTGARAADWGFDVTAGAAYDDNLSNGFKEADRNGAGSLTLGLERSLYQQLGSASGLTVAAVAEGALFDRYSGLNRLGLGGRVQLRHLSRELIAATAVRDAVERSRRM